jgi:ribosomal protein L44E
MSRAIPVTNKIALFFHCTNCINKRPDGTSPREWAQLECGWTKLGFQVWCKRCEKNIVHVDFEGVQHKANTTALKSGKVVINGRSANWRETKGGKA